MEASFEKFLRSHAAQAGDLTFISSLLTYEALTNIYIYISHLSQIFATKTLSQPQNDGSSTPIAAISNAICKAMSPNRLAILMRGIGDGKSLMPVSGAEIAWCAEAENLRVLYSNFLSRLIYILR